MLRIDHAAIGVLRGSQILFSACEDGGEMWTGRGARSVRYPVSFPEPFLSPPVVHVGLGMWDIAVEHNQRADISAVDVTETGFVLLFKTWSDTKVARVRAEWLAIGALPHQDAFDVD
ncbi:H-type lectin domain-containing protein [Paracoccus endophyticus]|uniref:H-type lectin domain-containing protein n=1 Tax=Paracoccus endophyticus TaxID=2233774 RepID=UPI000DDBB583|nr:H-type lectin domain-containing protein [Paracoccus endophyticus]